jgi:hypothetical protein
VVVVGSGGRVSVVNRKLFEVMGVRDILIEPTTILRGFEKAI